MKIRLGPILVFVDSTPDLWLCRAVFVFSDLDGAPPTLRYDHGDGNRLAAPTEDVHELLTQGADRVVAYDLRFARGASDGECSYGLDGEESVALRVPARGGTPHLAYASCCGFDDWRNKTDLESKGRDPWAMWQRLDDEHRQQPFHLLVLGGDQVYVDSLWSSGPLLEWRQKSAMVAGGRRPRARCARSRTASRCTPTRGWRRAIASAWRRCAVTPRARR